MTKSQYIMLGVAGLIIVSSAYVHGVYTDRWGRLTSEKLKHYTARLDDVPTKFGDWTSVPQEVDPAEFKASGCDGSFSRNFTNSVTDDVISVFLVSGRGYHATIHTPDQCYKAAGFVMGGTPQPHTFQTPGLADKNEVVHTVFRRDTPRGTEHLRILWTYSVDGAWKSPKLALAKQTLGTEEAIYKMYVIRAIQSAPEIDEDPAMEFLDEFLPLLNEALFPAEPAAAPVAEG